MEQAQFTFFSESLAQRYWQFCNDLGLLVALTVEDSPSGGDAVFNVNLQEEATEEQTAQLEAYYDELFFGEQAAEIDGNDPDGALADACGVQVKLQSGEYTTIAIHPQIMNKILSVLSIDELQQFLAQVAEDIENPKSGPICSRDNLPTI
ncbi:hypothetical protein THMIRHAS_01530 [Thiosulfatimonas sediminis]|uniref:Uncharacterized protein n=1 Tax=Thiosulfatimonas sediminis TaxID=2675054 RepID=A0A6F8PS15_9GAMM|nr:hypothetical protein [Thiosulfatimonas sediminis]BBP44780.1 hypothetical protein THMIRHAS_01530 [Thiosulfatimonas sediminis]